MLFASSIWGGECLASLQQLGLGRDHTKRNSPACCDLAEGRQNFTCFKENGAEVSTCFQKWEDIWTNAELEPEVLGKVWRWNNQTRNK